MNTELTEMDRNSRDALEGDQAPREQKKRGGGALAGLALLLALAALVGSGWLWWQDRADTGRDAQRSQEQIARLDAGGRELAQQIQQLGGEVKALRDAGTGSAVAALEGELRAERARLAGMQQSLEEQLTLSRSLQGAMDAMHSRLLAAEAGLARVAAPDLDAGSELDLAEVDYLLRLAGERLELFGDVMAADRALALAETHLGAMDNPAYFGVRREIAAARNALSAVEAVDPLKIASELDGVQARIASLPFQGAEPAAAPADESGEAGWWARLKSTLSGLVTVRRNTEEETTLSLEDKDYVRQRVWLQLEMAHLALMRRDQAAFRSALARARETLERWFAASDTGVQSAGRTLAGLEALEIEAELPDITGPWNSLRVLRAAGRMPAQPVDGNAAAQGPDTAAPEPPSGAGAGPEPEAGAEAETGDGDDR